MRRSLDRFSGCLSVLALLSAWPVSAEAAEVEQQLDDVAQVRQFEVTRPEGSPGEIWSLRLSRPGRLYMEDHYADLRGIPPFLAISRDTVLRPVK